MFLDTTGYVHITNSKQCMHHVGGVVGSIGARQPSMAGLNRAINAGSTFCGAQPPQPGLLVLGDMSVQGNVKPIRSLVEPLQVAMDNGAKRTLIPIENKRVFVERHAFAVYCSSGPLRHHDQAVKSIPQNARRTAIVFVIIKNALANRRVTRFYPPMEPFD